MTVSLIDTTPGWFYALLEQFVKQLIESLSRSRVVSSRSGDALRCRAESSRIRSANRHLRPYGRPKETNETMTPRLVTWSASLVRHHGPRTQLQQPASAEHA